MEWYEIAVNGERTVKFLPRAHEPCIPKHRDQKNLQQNDLAAESADEDFAGSLQLGGIIKRGAWGWLTSGNVLEITALRNGQTLASYEFTEARGYDNCCIRFVEELFPNNNETVLLAICIECFRAAGGGCSFVAIYSVEHGQVLSCMELSLHITAAAFVNRNCCRRSLLQNFDGCLAVGSEEGVILLLDLNINKILATYDERLMNTSSRQFTDIITVCKIADYNLPLAEIHRTFRQTRHEGVHFGLQLEVIDTPCSVQCLLPIDLALGLAIGLEDGRLAFYDLAEMQIFYITTPQPQQLMAPVVKLTYLEPLDDPRHCLYVFAMHENGENLSAVLHTLIYEKRLPEKDGFYYFESFLTSTARLQIPLEGTKGIAIGCQSISKIHNSSFNNSANGDTNATHTDEDGYCLCALSWYSTFEEKNKLLIFDLNQWYKEEMPYSITQQKCPSYLAGYVLSGRQCAQSAYLNPSTVAHFNSLQRFEEHFYPNSLSFDFVLLLQDSTLGYTWIGAQNKIINILRASNSSIFLEPDMYFREILRARLLPQFTELGLDSTFSRLAIYETILSVALEHNCYSILRDCAKCWADGSFMGSNFTATTGISLSTLTDWIWKRATDIKTRCNDLSKGLFDYAGYPLDHREQKELGYLTRQLKLLADLLGEVLSTGKRYIPDKVFLNLEAQHKSMRMASEYQDVLLWLLNIGLLPEILHNRNNGSPCKPHARGKGVVNTNSSNTSAIQYPYDDLKNLYARRRTFFARINENFISKKTGSCRLLFIDALIAHECKGDSLRECWLENGGNGLYPPPTIEAMLRILLVPEVEFENKCAILLYFFLDLHMTIDERAHKAVVESFVKFPSVFKLTAALIKTVQSFWNLDHGLFMPAVDEFISPFNNNQTYNQWMLELLIESLLTQNASDFALRILEARPNLISPLLKLKTLLASDLVSEAFHFARTKQDDSLLELFFKCCLCAGKYGVIRDLALNEREGHLLQSILRSSKTHGAENLHFVYLLQRSKYIEAVSYLDELSRAKNLRTNYGNESGVIGTSDTPTLVLSAFNTTMAPVTQGLTDVYFRIKNKIKHREADNRSPVPLSCQLIKQNANNLLGGIYHSSALSAHFATYYWGEMEDERKRSAKPASMLLSANNAPFLRKPQVETCHLQMEHYAQSGVSYPQPYKLTEKRTLAEREMELDEAPTDMPTTLNTAVTQSRKRRRLLGQEVVEDLGHFMQMNKSSGHLTARGFDLQAACESQAEKGELTTPCKTAVATEFLRQPLTTPRRRLSTLSDSRVGVSMPPSATSELHSILKTCNTPERSDRALSAIDESKYLRFKLPATEIEEEKETALASKITQEKLNRIEHFVGKNDDGVKAKRRIVTTTVVIDEVDDSVATADVIEVGTEAPNEVTQEDIEMLEDDAVDEVLIEVRHVKPMSCVDSSRTKQNAVECAVSVESNASKSNDVSLEEEREEEEGEDEDFYSPHSSYNNSLLVVNACSPLASTTAAIISSANESSTSKVFHFSGPQPRKPLARLSAERSQSCTPERQLPEQKQGNQPPPQSDIQNQLSSGYVSVTSRISTAVTSSNAAEPCQPTFQIKSVMSLASKDFAPFSSSSKICATQSKFNFEDQKVHVPRGKLSECSTIVGSFSVEMESGLSEADEVDKAAKQPTAYTQLKSAAGEFGRPTIAAQHLRANTTLEMSSYEYTLAEVKSQGTMKQTVGPEADGAKQNAAVLQVMETVEVMDMDEELEMETETENENDIFKEQQSQNAEIASNAVGADSDLYADALGIAVQHGSDGDVNSSEDSNDIVALYENQRAAKNQAAADSSDGDVIILSSSASSIQRDDGNETLDSESENDSEKYEDGQDEEEEVDDDEESENEDEDDADEYRNDSVENSIDDVSSIELDDESNNSASEKSRDITSEPIARPTVVREDNSADVGKEPKTANQAQDTQEASPDTSLHGSNSSTSVESDVRFVVEGAVSSCADYEELAMRETVVFEESGDEQHPEEGSQVGCNYFSKSVFMQKDAEITIEELNVSAYTKTTKEVYEELDSDVFYYGAETTSESLEFREERKIELNFEMETASTSKKAVIQSANFTTKPPENLVQDTLNNEEKPTCSVYAKNKFGGVQESNESIQRNVPKIDDARHFSAVGICITNKDRHEEAEIELANDVPSSKDIEGTEKDEAKGQARIHLRMNETEDTEKVAAGVPKIKGQKSVECEEREGSENTENEPIEEEQITLHVEECDLSEAELIEVEAEAANTTAVKNSSVKVATKAVEFENIGQAIVEPAKPDTEQESTQSSQSPIPIKEALESNSSVTEKQAASKKANEKNASKSSHTSSNILTKETEEWQANTPTRTRCSRRGTSVPPPADAVISTPVDEIITPRRNTRGISMPPQTTVQQEQEISVGTPETRGISRRNVRASSAQEEIAALTTTPRTRRSVRGVSMPHDEDESGGTPVRAIRGTSVPPPAQIVTRRRSNLLDAINESTPVVDSPSTRTRSRMRLNSAESELDSSVVSGSEQTSQAKRTRRSSISSSISEQPSTPSGRRTRRSTAATDAANSEVGTPKALRQTTRRKSANTENLYAAQPLEEDERETEKSIKTSENDAQTALYSSARRLTRTQLAIMEKSAALSRNAPAVGPRSGASISPPIPKRVSKRRSSRSTVQDSDDVESISSHLSNVSGTPKRRVTRSSMKDKEEKDDDLASIASSMGSERIRARRSKEAKSSPSTTLSTIQEDEAEEAGRRKRSKPIKNR
ncbi:uncharacterized protein LOC118748571 isoform X1 [Rhagoletis pomonella]|uniref:uncharacterized protein LOC118748571 isoform X1 n=1 Tax=Rhagoletis pomonella TaxID=28610 RepID=UPI0017863C9B|nr:uncharacterized protein LOC118748571 isoform X1 [Rhagoletis pomonella]